ncbi:hypothetical protein AKJ44_01275 [candidate division MSBL1 archaeon SCGC-AAA261F17]|uniref:Uncharacterized protein n=1 Tax=candidate division MSBL1 archaeon SCGC-AAA261F17 TaxID=1698274 RepID=A0A133V6U1_9EURY|nr:hypothetical protein AKJ44_01275 [candidate division MSBL1 archaeon SCGC-AAA261F17]
MSLRKPMSRKEISRKRFKLYQDGLSDREIAERMNVSHQAVQEWRSRRGLPPNPSERRNRIGKGLEGNIKPYLIEKIGKKPQLDSESVASEILEALDEGMGKDEAWMMARKLLYERISKVMPVDLISRAGEKLGTPVELEEEARRLVSEYRERKSISGSRNAIAAGAIYLA